jgi:hypothetical protein
VPCVGDCRYEDFQSSCRTETMYCYRYWYLFKRLTAVSAGRFYRFEHIVTYSSGKVVAKCKTYHNRAPTSELPIDQKLEKGIFRRGHQKAGTAGFTPHTTIDAAHLTVNEIAGI